jgi:hypothetical protein
MIRYAILLTLALAGAGGCGDETEVDGPGRPIYAQTQVCQWKTPCPLVKLAAPDGGADDAR